MKAESGTSENVKVIDRYKESGKKGLKIERVMNLSYFTEKLN